MKSRPRYQEWPSPDREFSARAVHWARLFAVILTLEVVIGSNSSAVVPGAGKPVVRPDAAVVRMLAAQPSRWHLSLARQFVKNIPARIIEPLGGQTAKTIPFLTAKTRIPKTGIQDEYFCWASSGRGGGYAAFIYREHGVYRTVWDSLVPPTFIAPQIEFVDLTGDSAAEIICSGQLLDSALREWLILGWDGKRGHVLAPRLDRPARHFTYNRLIGRSLEITDTPGSAAKTLILTLGKTPGDSAVVADSTVSTRVFSYDKSLDAFLPPP